MNKIFAFILSIFSALIASTSAHASERAVQGWDLIAQGAKVVDVRTPQEFATGHLENAVNIPLQELDQRIGELDKDQMLVLYCRSGARSGRAYQYLQSQGFTKIHNGGGLQEMQSAAPDKG